MNALDNNNLHQKILVEQIRLLYRITLPILAVNLLISSALLLRLWNVVSKTALTVWMILMLLVIVARVIAYLNYRRHFKAELAQRYGLYFVIGTGMIALVWGIGVVVLFPTEDLESQLLILFVLVGMGAGAVSTLTNYLPAFYTYFLISMIPITIQFFRFGDSLHLSLGVMTCAYIAALCYFGLSINRTLKQSLKLRFENIDLVEQLREQKDAAELANMSKSKFLAAASHDLRQPLHALTLFTSVLDESSQKPKERKAVNQINASVQALQSLFNALLDISQLEAGVMKVEKTEFFLQPVFKNLANDFDPQAREKGLAIMWPVSAYAVYSDKNLLEQILRNYIANAVRYTHTGEITITSEADLGLLTISVIDTGVGIPEDEQQAIFEEFHQLSNPERDRSKGLGLGLAIVQRTATLLEHAIAVESQPNKGSSFSITVEQANITESASVLKPQFEGDFELADSTLIVVIDDEISIREGTQNLLELWGCKVITAENKEEAIAQLEQQDRSPDGIIADYRLRENHTGIEAIHAIHAKYNNDIPALIVTGDIAAERLREVNSSGFQVLHKPVAPLKLRTFLRNVQLRK